MMKNVLKLTKENANKVLIVYHKEDNDGVFSAALMYHWIVDCISKHLRTKKENVTLLGADYNMLDTLAKDRKNDMCPYNWINKFGHVYMLDISFNNWKVMKFLHDAYNCSLSFSWFDHHGPALALAKQHGYDDTPGYRATTTSTIGLVYEHLFDVLRINQNKGNMPELLQYLAGWDSFHPKQYCLELDDCYGVNLVINRDFELDFDKVYDCVKHIMYDDGSESDYGRNFISETVLEAESIVDYENYKNKQLVNNYGDFDWKFIINGKERKAVALFCQGPSSSRMFESVADKVDHAIVFKHLPNGKWSGSIYNVRQDDDKEYNLGRWIKSLVKTAGGHPGAAGFTISNSKFNKWNKNKTVGG